MLHLPSIKLADMLLRASAAKNATDVKEKISQRCNCNALSLDARSARLDDSGNDDQFKWRFSGHQPFSRFPNSRPGFQRLCKLLTLHP